jgi:hydroxymethylpyrimidine pyrophosphatase-like HAD family hydrolase
MIFASDLDRTLIYSKKFLIQGLTGITVVEEKNHEALSHMSNESINLLSLINEKLFFVPTTTRSLEQYNRIGIFQNQIRTKYAIVANGGILLKNNCIDLNWAGIIKEKLANLTKPMELIKECEFFLKDETINSYRCCDNLFIYAVLKSNNVNMEKYSSLQALTKQLNYTVTRNGRKIYIIPNFLNKWEPIKHIMNLEQDKHLIAAGDSILDLPMLLNATYGVIPLHGELHDDLKEKLTHMKNLHFTTNQGIMSSNEFLEDILSMIS